MMFSSVTLSYNQSFYCQNLEQNSINFKQISTKTQEFLDYWDILFAHKETCDITYDEFKEMYTKYNDLSAEEKAIVDETQHKDSQYKIKDVINTLINKFNSAPTSSGDEKEKLDQSTMIAIISGVAIFGMSTILIFYILKNKNIIK